jgi:hypothetical protein
MLDTEKFIFEINHDKVLWEPSPCFDSVIKYFLKSNQKIYYGNVNPFDFLDINLDGYINNIINNYQYYFNRFLQKQSNQITNQIKFNIDSLNFVYVYSIKFIADSILCTNKIVAPLCFFGKNFNYEISKGHKKIISCKFINLQKHPVFITTSDDLSSNLNFKQIMDDNEFYDKLKNIDNAATKFYIHAQIVNNIPAFHYITDVNKKNYIDITNNYFIPKSLILPLTVGFLGNAYTDDTTINAILDNAILDNARDTKLGHIEAAHRRLSNKYPNYYCTVYSPFKKNISAKYLHFISSNLYLRSNIQIAYTHDITNIPENDLVCKFSHDGIISKVPNF